VSLRQWQEVQEVLLAPAQVNLVNSEVADQTAGYPTLPGTRLASVSLTTANASP